MDFTDLFAIVIPRLPAPGYQKFPGTVRGTVLVDVVLFLQVGLSRTTKITVKVFTIISTYSPLAAEKSGDMNDRVTAYSPYSGARRSGA